MNNTQEQWKQNNIPVQCRAVVEIKLLERFLF